jgi:hypothetical protein
MNRMLGRHAYCMWHALLTVCLPLDFQKGGASTEFRIRPKKFNLQHGDPKKVSGYSRLSLTRSFAKLSL